MDMPTIRSAREDERQAVLAVITLAFATDPVARWAQPNPTKYFAEFGNFADALGGGGLAQDATLVADGLEGAAMWLPPGGAEVIALTYNSYPDFLANNIASSAFSALNCEPALRFDQDLA